MFYNPYQTIGDPAMRWRKANFHTHAGVCIEGACGVLPMREVIVGYREALYDVLAISNHDQYIAYPEGIEGISLLDAVEYSPREHMLLVGVKSFENLPHQEAIDWARKQGGFVILCHPNWKQKEYWSYEKLEALTGYTGIEIYNPVIFRLSGSGLATDTWDHLLSVGKTVFGFGNDDFHQWMDLGRVNNRMLCASDSFADVRDAAARGATYVSTGVVLERYAFDGKTLSVKAGTPVPSYVDSYTYDFIGKGGALLGKVTGSEASFPVAPGEAYVRVEVTSEAGAKMYLQPLMNRDFFVELP